MANFHELTTAKLKQAVQLREQIESLQEKLDALLGGGASTPSAPTGPRAKGRRAMSPATKKKMAAAQQARWAKIRGEAAPVKAAKKAPAAKAAAAPKKRKGLTEEGRAKLAAAMKARWAARKKAGAPAPNAPAK